MIPERPIQPPHDYQSFGGPYLDEHDPDDMYDREVIRKMDEERDNAAPQATPSGGQEKARGLLLPLELESTPAAAAPKLDPFASWPFPRSET